MIRLTEKSRELCRELGAPGYVRHLAAQAVLFGVIQKKTQASASAANLATDAAHTYGAAFASVMATLPFPVNIAVAPGAAAAAAAAMQAGALGAAAAGSAAGAGMPAFHEGGFVPGSGESTALLEGGELVLTRSQQRRFLRMIDGGIPGQAGGNTVAVTINAPNYLGGRDELERVLLEAFRTAAVRGELRRIADEPLGVRRRV